MPNHELAHPLTGALIGACADAMLTVAETHPSTLRVGDVRGIFEDDHRHAPEAPLEATRQPMIARAADCPVESWPVSVG